jgi:glycosyltransferase involved in cell wall biosynthesis
MPGSLGRHDTIMHVPAHMNLIERLSTFFDITVYTYIKPDRDSREFKLGGATVKYIPVNYDEHVVKKIYHFLRAFYHDHRVKPFDLIHGFGGLPCGFVAVIVGKLFARPNVVSLRGGESASLPEINYGDMRKQPLRMLTLWTCDSARTLTTLTRFQFDSMKTYGLKRNDVEIIPFGVNAEFFIGSDIRKDLNPPFRFIHVGYLNEVKDQTTLLRAFQRISEETDCTLTIIGEDYLHGQLKDLAEDLGIADNVQFLGYVPQADLRAYYASAHVMLHTSLHEGQGVVVVEAAANKVVICGTCTGLIYDLKDSCAIAVGSGDSSALATKVISLLKNPVYYYTLQQNAYAWSQQHSLNWTVERFEELYERLVRT